MIDALLSGSMPGSSPSSALRCHVGYRSCFYRSVPVGSLGETPVPLTFEEREKVFDPVAVYGDAPNPTQL